MGGAVAAVYCPIGAQVHPAVELLEQRSLARLQGFGLLDDPSLAARFRAVKGAALFARIVPEGLVERVQIFSDWLYWAAAFDDLYMDAAGSRAAPLSEFVRLAAKLTRLLEVGELGSLADDPFARMLHDINRRFGDLASCQQRGRWVEAHRRWFAGVAWQIGNEETGDLPNLADFLSMRLRTIGADPVVCSLDFAHGLEVPNDALHRPEVRALTEMAAMLCALDNDLFSRFKESEGEESLQNIVSVLERQNALSGHEAVAHACALRDRIMKRYLEVSAVCQRGPETALQAYVSGLSHMVRGNLDWTLRVRRYGAEGASSHTPVVQAYPVSPIPADPVELAPIRWWWA